MGPSSELQRLYEEFAPDETPDEQQVNIVFHTYDGFLFSANQREHRFRLSPERARELLWRLHLFNMTWGLLAFGGPVIGLLSYFNYSIQRTSIGSQERANADELAARRRPGRRRPRRAPEDPTPGERHRPRSAARLLVGFLGVALMMVSTLVGCFAIPLYLEQRGHADWPLVTAEMMDFEVKPFSDEDPTHHWLRAKYRYTVNGTRFVGHDWTRNPLEADHAELDRLKTLYATGNSVEIRVSPSNSTSTELWLEYPESEAFWAEIAVAFLFVGFGVTAFGFWPRKSRRVSTDRGGGQDEMDPGFAADRGEDVVVPEHEAHKAATAARRVVRQERVMGTGEITRTYRHLACGGETPVSGKLLRSLASPTMGPGKTDCSICGKREEIEQFAWTHTDETIFQAQRRIHRELPLPLRVVTSIPTAVVVFAGGIAIGVVAGMNSWWWKGLRVGIAATAVLVGLNIAVMRLLAKLYGIKFERML